MNSYRLPSPDIPDAYVNEKFYEPGDMGYERDIKKHLDKIKSEA